MTIRPTADVTVVIATFNRARFLPEAIESMLAQHLRPARIVIVDDGSTDGTQQVAERYADKVEYIRKENGGKALALNFILPTLTTRYVWFFDDDDAAYPEALQKLLGTLEKSPEMGFAFGSFDTVRTDADLLKSVEIKVVKYPFPQEPLNLQRLRLYRNCVIMMSGSLIRTEALRSVGGFNKELRRSQDYDLMVRLASRFNFAYCGSSIYIVREHDGVRGSLDSQHKHADRARMWAIYNEPIGRYLRYQVPLNALLPNPAGDQTSPEKIRTALMVRAWALTPKMKLEFVVCDLIEALNVSDDAPLDDFESEILKETFNDDFVAFRSTRALLRLWRLALKPVGCDALAFLAKGLYWQSRKEAYLGNRLKLTSISLLLLGVSSLAKLPRFSRALRPT